MCGLIPPATDRTSCGHNNMTAIESGSMIRGVRALRTCRSSLAAESDRTSCGSYNFLIVHHVAQIIYLIVHNEAHIIYLIVYYVGHTVYYDRDGK